MLAMKEIMISRQCFLHVIWLWKGWSFKLAQFWMSSYIDRFVIYLHIFYICCQTWRDIRQSYSSACVFLSDLKKLYFQAGVENKPTVFLFNDIQVVEEGFLEDINNILSSGEVPNLYKPDEFEEVRDILNLCKSLTWQSLCFINL